MSTIIINNHVFDKHQQALYNLSGAMDHLTRQVGHLLEDLPKEVEAMVRDLLDHKISGIMSVCGCIENMAEGLAADAGDWQFWANMEKIKIVYRPAAQ